MTTKKKLMGDRIEEIFKAMRADKAAAMIERATGKPCNCGQRKEKINELHKERMRRKALKQLTEKMNEEDK